MGGCIGLASVPDGDILLIIVSLEARHAKPGLFSLSRPRTFPLTPFPGEGGMVMGRCTGLASVPGSDIPSIIVSKDDRHAKPRLFSLSPLGERAGERGLLGERSAFFPLIFPRHSSYIPVQQAHLPKSRSPPSRPHFLGEGFGDEGLVVRGRQRHGVDVTWFGFCL